MTPEKGKFKHVTEVSVRNYEIDWQGIVHNANYLLYFEIGRVGYLEQLGAKLDVNTVRHESKVVVARNEIDYLSPAQFGETLTVYTRISVIRNTSFFFEGYIEEESGHRPISSNVSIHVWLDHRTGKPMSVPAHFRKLVGEYEGENALIEKPGLMT